MITVIDHASTGFPAELTPHCARLMARYYREKFGLDDSFETWTASSLAHFGEHFDPRRDAFWTVVRDGETVGCAAVQRPANAAGAGIAQFRWFFLAASTRHLGLGRQLLGRALDFAARAGYARLALTTHEDLRAAVHLYEEHGFGREGSAEQDFHGRRLTLTNFGRDLRAAADSEPARGRRPSSLVPA